jgi:hypothetical protein
VAATSRESEHPARARSVLAGLFAVAFGVSIIHYVDNVVNYADYPEPTSVPAPSAALIAASWFAFTACGLTGYVLFVRGRYAAAAMLVAVYSLSGLVGLGHYAVAGAFDMPLWRQLHILADIVCGAALLTFAVWVVRRRASPAAGGRPRTQH